MTEIIVTTPEQLQTTIEAAVSKAFEAYTKKPTTPENIENDNLTIEEAAAFLNDNGCKITVQTIYTKKLQGKIPCSKIGSRLVFSKKALLAWIERHTVPTSRHDPKVRQTLRKAPKIKGYDECKKSSQRSKRARGGKGAE